MIRSIQMRKIKINQLNPAEYNPRKLLRRGDKGYDKLKNSLDTFGEVLPIVWNEQTGNIVGGHQRYYMYLDEGIKSVEVSVVDIPLEKEKILNITLNNDNVGSEWDRDKLSSLIQEIDTPDLQLTGFDVEELDSLLSGMEELSNLNLNTEDFNELGADDPEEEQDPEELPYEEPQETKPPSEVFFKIGKYEFMIDGAIYSTWLQELKGSHGDDIESIIDEIKIRLQL